jgi:cell division inhibitor SepF
MAVYLGLMEDGLMQEETPTNARESRPLRTVESLPGVAPMVAEPPSIADGVAKITTLHPRSYNDAKRIGEDFRQGIPVIVNLTELGEVDAKRIVDFAAGLTFGLNGRIERVTSKVFLLSPANIDVGVTARAQLAEDGFYNQS